MRQTGTRTLNVMGSPGCGKTALLERLLPALRPGLRCAVLEGDLATTRDAERIAALGTPVIQLETQGSCHLDAALVLRGLRELPLNKVDLVFIENVGNLVCPVNFELGETARLAVVSTTEGHDKPSKYPQMFARADGVAISKMDLLPYTNFDVSAACDDVRKFNRDAPIFRLGLNADLPTELLAWIKQL